MITEDYVSFEIAKLLKEKGFDGECRAFWKDWNGEIRLCSCNNAHMFEYCHNSMLERYNDAEETNIAAPTLQMAMKWLREEHDKSIEVRSQGLKATGLGWVTEIYNLKNQDGEYHNASTQPSYEEACEAAIKYCLENLI
jgi:hypothetical protein